MSWKNLYKIIMKYDHVQTCMTCNSHSHALNLSDKFYCWERRDKRNQTTQCITSPRTLYLSMTLNFYPSPWKLIEFMHSSLALSVPHLITIHSRVIVLKLLKYMQFERKWDRYNVLRRATQSSMSYLSMALTSIIDNIHSLFLDSICFQIW